MWNSASNYLQKFFNIKPPKKFLEDEIIKVIKDASGLDLNNNNILYKQGVVYIKSANNFIKNNIFFKKDQILKSLPEKIKPFHFKDIKFN